MLSSDQRHWWVHKLVCQVLRPHLVSILVYAAQSAGRQAVDLEKEVNRY